MAASVPGEMTQITVHYLLTQLRGTEMIDWLYTYDRLAQYNLQGDLYY